MTQAKIPAARKVYVTGSRPDIRVPVREIELSDANEPVQLYDTSGPYTDPEANPTSDRACRRSGCSGFSSATMSKNYPNRLLNTGESANPIPPSTICDSPLAANRCGPNRASV